MRRRRSYPLAVIGDALLLLCLLVMLGVMPEAAQVLVRPAQPVRHHIDAAHLPPPYATPSVDNGPRLEPEPSRAVLYAPARFHVSRWASGLDNPRWIATAPNGDLFVAESRAGRVAVLRDPGGGGAPRERQVFASGLRQPFGIAFYPPGPNPQAVYVANTDAVLRFPYRSGDLHARGAPTVVMRLPGGGYNQHWTRTVAFSPDGKRMFVSVGSRSNVGEEAPPRACVMVSDPAGKGARVYASGLRNAVGLAFEPGTGALWAAVNERDGLGDDVPPDYATAVKPGGFYGWPYSYIGRHPDPRMPRKPALEAKAIVPDVLLEAHCAALSVLFYTGSQFPPEYRGQAFVAMHGSWNRRSRSGYKVVQVPIGPNGRADGSYVDFVWGWKAPSGGVWGRPVALAQARDGALFVSDDGGNCIWRVSYR